MPDNKLPSLITLPDGTQVAVTWLRYASYTTESEDVYAQILTQLEQGKDVQVQEPTPEERDIIVPILPPQYASRENFNYVLNNYSFSQDDEGVYYKMTDNDFRAADINTEDYTKVASYYSLIREGLESGIFTQNEITSNRGLMQALTTYTKSLAAGGIFDENWFNKMQQITDIIPDATFYNEIGISVTPQDWTAQMVNEPVANAMIRLDEQLASVILSGTPEEIETTRRNIEKQKINILRNNGLTQQALAYTSSIPYNDLKTQTYAQILAEGTANYNPMTQYAIKRFISARPENILLFEQALNITKQEAQEQKDISESDYIQLNLQNNLNQLLSGMSAKFPQTPQEEFATVLKPPPVASQQVAGGDRVSLTVQDPEDARVLAEEEKDREKKAELQRKKFEELRRRAMAAQESPQRLVSI